MTRDAAVECQCPIHGGDFVAHGACIVEDELPIGPDDGIDTDVETVIGGGISD